MHRQTRRTLGIAGAFTAAAPVAVVVPHGTGTWLPLHLFLVGGLLSAISGATQLLAVTWSASPAPPRRAASAQRWLLAAGALAVVGGRELGTPAVTAMGGAAVAGALLLLGAILVRIRSSAVTDRFLPAIDAYLLAVAAGLAGTTLAVVLVLTGVDGRMSDLRSAHLAVNLLGLVGLVVAGTLPYFAATQMRAKMSGRATPARLRAAAVTLAAATALAAGGHLVGRPGVAAAGLVVYAGGIAAVLGLVPVPTRRQLAWAGPRLLQIALGTAWWLGTTLALAFAVATGRSDGPILQAMAIGGFAQILLGSLAYLEPVIRGGGHQRLAEGFAATRSWPGLAAANIAAVGALAGEPTVTGIAVSAWAVDSALRAIRFARQTRRG